MDPTDKINFLPILLQYWIVFKHQLPNLATYVGLIALINMAIVFPIIFNWYVIPNIEKKIGQKLEFTISMYSMNIFPRLARCLFKYVEVAGYIMFSTLFNRKIILRGLFPFALAKVQYNSKQSSVLEIILSYLAFLNGLLGIACGILLMFIGN